MTQVLIVEDDTLSRELLTEALLVAGYEVATVASAEEALVRLLEGPLDSIHPDLILMDIQLPGLDGLAATRALKEDMSTSGIPVIAITAHAMKGDEQRILDAGCQAYLVKPLDLSRLQAAVRASLPSRKDEDRSARAGVALQQVIKEGR